MLRQFCHGDGSLNFATGRFSWQKTQEVASARCTSGTRGILPTTCGGVIDTLESACNRGASEQGCSREPEMRPDGALEATRQT